MENQALISVIIPVYNVEEYLHKCVDSVINQTYKNIEILLIDDGSTDSSGRICDEYSAKDERIRVIHQQNGGLSVARNTGIDASNGDYIYFLDSDDYIAENALEILLTIAVTDNSEIVFYDAVSFADTNDFKIAQNYIRKNTYNKNSGYNIFSKMTENGEFHSAVYLMFFNKQFVIKNFLSFVPDILHEDMVFSFIALCKAKAVSQCKQALYYRRYRKNSIMTSKKSKKHFTSCISVYRHNSDFAKELKQEDNGAAIGFVCRCAFNVFNVYEKLDKKYKKDCKNDLIIFTKDVLANNAFGNTALKMRCHGKAFWFIYKIFEKTVGRLLKGKK